MARKRSTANGKRKDDKPRVAVEVFLRRRAQKRVVLSVVAVVGLCLLIAADRAGLLLHPGDDMQRFDGKTFRVTRIVDGDTLHVRDMNETSGSTRVRLWGVDTPEIQKLKEGLPAQAFGDAAHDFTRSLCEAQTITLTLEPGYTRDRYGRLLAYVQLPDGRILNEQLILAGLAKVDQRFAHREMNRYQLLLEQSKFKRAGMWKK